MARPTKRPASALERPLAPHCITHGEKLSLYIAFPRMKTRGRCPQGCDLTKTQWRTKG